MADHQPEQEANKQSFVRERREQATVVEAEVEEKT